MSVREPPQRFVIVAIAEPGPDREFVIGAEFTVSGTATGTGRRAGAGNGYVVSVSVLVGSAPPVAAELDDDGRTVHFRATVSLAGAGTSTIVVSASDDNGNDGSARVVVYSQGLVTCVDAMSWLNYPRTLSGTPMRTCTPRNVEELAGTITGAEAAGVHVHAFGSRWSFSDCAYTPDVAVDTHALSSPLQTVQAALLPTAPASVVHVEAGMRIRELYIWLDSQGLALETMGGASGQTVAGAVATGTHGGDKAPAAIGDSVLALHLVGSGGVQYWIEPTQGVTDPERLHAIVAPGVDLDNIVYDDDVFNACLVSLGAFGTVYAVVLRVRPAYDLVETTTETTWTAFRDAAATWLDDPSTRFVQVLVSPYKNPDGQNSARLTTRTEAQFTTPGVRPVGDTTKAVENAVDAMSLTAKLFIGDTFVEDPSLGPEQNLARLVELVRVNFNADLLVLAEHYPEILRQAWPATTWRGGAHSVMDIGASSPIPSQQPGLSFELAFPARTPNGALGVERFVDSVSNIIEAETPSTFFVGYVSLRFSGGTKALIGGQQWPATCTVEVSLAQGVQGDHDLMTRLYGIGVGQGGIPHWGQLVDLGLSGEASIYPKSPTWRSVYGQFSSGFTLRTFENALTRRWGLTDPSEATFVSSTMPPALTVSTTAAVTVTMRNSGPLAWIAGTGFVLRVGSAAAWSWGVTDIELLADTPAGGDAVFTFVVTAPALVSSYPFAARMAQRDVRSFGESTPALQVSATPAPGKTTVPNVIGLSFAGAEAEIHSAGLTPQASGRGRNPTVQTQQPRAGTQVDPGSTVFITLAAGDPN